MADGSAEQPEEAHVSPARLNTKRPTSLRIPDETGRLRTMLTPTSKNKSSYGAWARFRKPVMDLIGGHIQTGPQLDLKSDELFTKFDADKDGELSSDELL